MTQKLRITLWYGLYVLLLIWPALYNMFPLVTPDTGSYIHSGLALSIPGDRPWLYGIFLLLTSWGVSPWFPVFWQGFFCAWLVIRLGKKCIAPHASYAFWAGVILVISGLTAAAWYNAQLMADAFTGLMLLALLLLYLKPENRKEQLRLELFVIFCLLTHVSHMLTVALIAAALLIYYHRRRKLYERQVSLRLLCFSGATMLVISISNLIGNKHFGLSACPHLFLISRMAENGILDTYLKDQCPTDPNILCPYQDSFGLRQWDFMWNGRLPHMQKEGWEKTYGPYMTIIRKSLTHPKYLSMHVVRNVEGGLKQLTQLQVIDGINQNNAPGSPVYETLKKEFPSYLKEFRADGQNNGQLPLSTVNVIMHIGSLLMIALTLLLWSGSKMTDAEAGRWKLLFGVAVSYIIANAFITATFSTVIGRLQARVFWVLPVLCLFYLIRVGYSLLRRSPGKIQE